MAKPSGIKSTDFIDRTARWFGGQIGHDADVCYRAHSWDSSYWSLTYSTRYWYFHETFASFTAMRSWMDAEIRRRRILFRDYRG